MLSLVVALALTQAAAPVPEAEQLRFFETSVRPLLVEKCFKCHGDAKQWAGLRLDSRAGLLKGGDNGPALVSGHPEESLLIRAVKQVDEELKMPPDSRLTDQQIADLERWIALGAIFPVTEQGSKHRSRDPNHWAFQPPVAPPVPAVNAVERVRNPVDRFILARLEQAEIAPAAEADRLSLLRRVTFDLTGLPPTPAEVAEFAADARPDAYEHLVERLLASAAYGERWGRHWLDVARYADSNGLDENVAHGNAWRYRDWVVAQFNADKPFDRFLVEQLAGDLLPFASEAERQSHLIATGFLGLGPKVLAEVDEAKMRMDIVDEQIETVGRVFLGMTLGCARCHDHKFDPINTTDYYALAGVFKSTQTMDQYTKVAKWHENVLPGDETRSLQAEFDRQLKTRQQQIDELVVKANDTARAAVAGELKDGATEPTQEQLEAKYPDETKAALKKLRDELAAFQKAGPELPSAIGVQEDKIIDVAVHIRGNPLKLGEVVPRQVPQVFRGVERPQFSASQSGRMELAQWLVQPQHPLTARVIVNRVWRWHFGQGLVHSVDNFGLLGEAPSHPELLDWLAGRLIADGWSLKSLHRLLVTSNTYRQSSVSSAAALAKDPENRLYSRAAVRRLEAEEVRDALLASAGRLDRLVGGSLLKVKNRAYFFDHTSKDLTDYTSDRRSLYLPVVRNNVYDLFQLLDYPDAAVPSGDRSTTTVAPQALLMMNSDFVMDLAESLARQLLDRDVNDTDRIGELWLRTYGRPASRQEIDSSLDYLAQLERAVAAPDRAAPAGTPADTMNPRQQAWSILCHTTLAANEFVYLR